MRSRELAWTSVILAGKSGSRRHSSTSFSENVVVAETSYQMLEILSFCDRERTQSPSIKITVLTFLVNQNGTNEAASGCPFFESRDLTKPRRRRQRERQKTTGLMSKTTALRVHHAFLYISLPSLHNYDVKCLNYFKFTWERKRQGDKFYHLCPNLSVFPSLQLRPKSPSFP